MVDVQVPCPVCGRNLGRGIPAGTPCGTVCARVLEFGESPVVAHIRAKIAARQGLCFAGCPGWAVFNADSDPHLERCDECWGGEDDPLHDEELEALPEAKAELKLAGVLRDSYKPPYMSPQPCKCGCVVFRANHENDDEQCMGCDASRLRECHCAEPGNCDICRDTMPLPMMKRLREAVWNHKEELRDPEIRARLEGLIEEADEIIAAMEEAEAEDKS